MSKSFYVTLANRGLIQIEGEDRVSFLNGLVSNDVAQLKPGTIQYSCLLTPQGKFLHDFFLHDAGNVILMDCEGGARARDLYDRLNKFRLRAKVKISVEENHPVYAVFYAGEGLPDPRNENMGRRAFEKPDMEEKPFEEWDRLRISLTVPDGSRDMEIEKSTLLECGIEKLNGIDWNKGCYMGQELTARMKYRGLAKKHLYTVTFKDKAPVPFSDLPSGGNMRSSCGDIGIALLKDGEPTCL
ncbi:MAG: folate-binding protein [Micavibrio aeruginosavorus]|uniref:Folate-binding protein n=1 Tax=Micavibrio aeruginosavorus TaxID=349221 RepID=A0A2W5MZI6_9BACT|nr:MAG: folate-binding protein [Micavibrio aeruginosavorus]